MLRFPDLSTLQLALSSGAVPPGVAEAPAAAAFDDRGAVRVRPSVKLPRQAVRELKRIGVQEDKEECPTAEPVVCWAQLLPVRRDPSGASPGDTTPVVFDLPGIGLPALVGEILRLGNDRQSLRWLDDGGKDGGRALLRVVGPPYYALLRALEHDGGDGPRAYVERAPRVLVELGYTHPLLDRLRPPTGRLLLMRSPRQWDVLPDGNFRDVYEVLDFQIPDRPVRWRQVEPATRITAPLRLARGQADDAAELWVIRDRTDEQLEGLVRNADNRLLARLAFAVGKAGDRAVVVLRVRPSKQAPPVLVLDGESYRTYLRLPNLFLPVGSRLHPPLRRDAVARLLASDPARLTWLAPRSGGGFAPESLPDEAFRPLDQWVDYLLDQDSRALDVWVHSTRFEFEPFVCHEDDGKTSPGARGGRSGAGGRRERGPENALGTTGTQAPERPTRPPREFKVDSLPAVEPGEAERRLGEVEARFLALEAPLDAGERLPLWREMAALNAALGRAGDASLCWSHALWEGPEPEPGSVEAWARAEPAAAADHLPDDDKPSSADLRALATRLIRAAHGPHPEPGLTGRLDRIQHYWERHEARVPVRVAWMAWCAVARLSGGDTLALARARDRALERLHQHGLSRDRDLPGFLGKVAGGAGERSRRLGDDLTALHAAARSWVARGSLAVSGTRALVDLTFAFGLARLGAADASGRLAQAGLAALAKQDPVCSWLSRAYEFRVQLAAGGKPAAGPLPTDLLKTLENFDRTARYKVDRLREHSQLLEPHERLAPYRHWHGKLADEVAVELAQVVDLTDRAELMIRMGRLLALPPGGPNPEAREARILSTGLSVAFRLGESFARELFGRVIPLVDRLDDPRPRALLLERGLHLAAHFDQSDHARAFVGRFVELLEDAGEASALALEPLLARSFRGLRKLGLRDEIGLLLDRMARLCRQGDRPPEETRTGLAAQERGRRLRLLLHVAAGWFYSGQGQLALPVLDDARDLLFHGDLNPVEQTALACGYVRALGLAPVSQALPRVAELFQRLERVHDTFTTNSHYSLSRFDVVEAVVLTLVSDDFLLDEAGRRWLEDDEYLVRRRIHRDVRAALGTGG